MDAISDKFSGEWIVNPADLKHKLSTVKAFVFDWDGVFNNGEKDINGNSTFSEIDSMGINLLRFSYFLLYQKVPAAAVITGENNQLAKSFATRENFNAVYSKAAHKGMALTHLCGREQLSASNVLFMFDDVLDLSAAKIAGVRIMVSRSCNPMLLQYAKDHQLVDYFTHHHGDANAIREACEMLMTLNGTINEVFENRIKFSDLYQQYIHQRKNIETVQYNLSNNFIVKQ